MLKILCLFRDQYAHIKPVEQYLASPATFIYDADWKPENILTHQPDLVIGINEFHLDIAKCYEQAQKLNIPTLTIQDGILEWRFLFENPIYNGNETGVPMHHPVLADKYACMGPLMADFIGALGNANKVEVVGMPKMDQIISSSEAIKKNRKKKVLILTSSKPWFYDNQRDILIKSLRDLKSFFNQHTEIEPVWRITKGLDEILQVENQYKSKDSVELTQQLTEVDAVITTISTTIIESFLMCKPVSTLDYFNTPVLVPTVWRITAQNQIAQAVQGILNPTSQQLWLQQVYQDMVIRRDVPAAETTANLILAMVNFRKENPDSVFPVNMVRYPGKTFSFPAPKIEEFYPKRQAVVNQDVEWLKARLVRAERENAAMRKDLTNRSFWGVVLLTYNKLHRWIRRKK